MNDAKMDEMPVEFDILHEDAELLIVDKPAHLLVHPSKPDGPPTLWHGLRALLAYELATGGQISIVNRLDRETSGLTVVAKSAVAARRLGRAMMRREIGKEYLAIARGWPEHDEFTIDAPILRAGEVDTSAVYVKQMVHPLGRPCRTGVKVEKRFARDGSPYCLARVFPETGRMHQIRVHFAHAGYPLVGDKIYTNDGTDYLEFLETGWTPELAGRLLLDRHALHSAAITIEDQRWECPLARDMGEWMHEGR
jgi:23S rRNA pseudouridine1911/1915/1917 synthase